MRKLLNHWPSASKSGSSKAEGSEAESSKAEGSEAESSKAEGSEAESSEAEPSETEPNGNTQTDLNDYSNEYLNLFMKIPSDFEKPNLERCIYFGRWKLLTSNWILYLLVRIPRIFLGRCGIKCGEICPVLYWSFAEFRYYRLQNSERRLPGRLVNEILIRCCLKLRKQRSAMRFLAVFIDGQTVLDVTI